jgi:NADH:ubiquinone oxidoreductase subunit 2 (subunit N)
MTYLVIIAFIAIIGSLIAALVFMMRGSKTAGSESNSQEQQPNKGMARALAFRVGFSILLFLLVLFSAWMGWIQPTGIASGR